MVEEFNVGDLVVSINPLVFEGIGTIVEVHKIEKVHNIPDFYTISTLKGILVCEGPILRKLNGG